MRNGPAGPPRDRPSLPVRARHWLTTRVYRPVRTVPPWTWIGDTRIAIGGMPMPDKLGALVDDGVTDVVNCRAVAQTCFSADLATTRAVFGREHVAHAPMWDHGRPQDPRAFAEAARFAARALDDPRARVLIHCQQGRRRSVLVAYAVLRLRGWSGEDAAREILAHRVEGRLVPAYRRSVEDWLAREALRSKGADAPGRDERET